MIIDDGLQLHLHSRLKNDRNIWSYTPPCARRKSAPAAVSCSWIDRRKSSRTGSSDPMRDDDDDDDSDGANQPRIISDVGEEVLSRSEGG